jgi:peptidoglycan hydrolase-like protein with peptidoglycan-binding domain
MGTQLQHLIQILEPDRLRLGSTVVAVVSLQLVLQELPLLAGPVDGCFGPNTALALQQVQQEFRLPQTGELDAAIWYALTFWREPTQSGSSSPRSDQAVPLWNWPAYLRQRICKHLAEKGI